ncbi:DNA glycosylase AlkZ-like family protein [Deinococcus sonorensis]|uniref:Crosslink repair DNA glycosylase YcaQ family protein n=2 Tax=Deinococcus sonorensis TaxID=309891 RepID=A0AAU7UC50_9DEIO
MNPAPTLAQLRSAALGHTLWPRTGLQAAITRLGFVQADPIRAPARAQDLILMQRVRGYRAGDLERRYAQLDVEEDVLPNYGFVTREVQRLLHPRQHRPLRIETEAPGLLEQVLALAQPGASLHPREVEAALGRQAVSNAWGGQSSASTRALDALHYRGHLRVVRRDSGVRVYGPATHLQAAEPLTVEQRTRGVVLLLARLYGPLPQASLGYLLSLCGYGLPGLKADLRAALKAAVGETLAHARLDGVTYLWPADASLDATASPGVRLVAPFDPLVWDRRRFALLHGWTYRFEAYTPPAKRVMGYYALPVFHHERAVGWANLKVVAGELTSEVQLIPGVRHTAAFTRGLDAELARYRAFLGLSS